MTRAAHLLIAGLLVVAACGGSTTTGPGIIGPEDGGGADQVACVDVQIGAADVTCRGDGDCALARTGHVCDGECSCGGTPVNSSAAARAQAQTAGLRLEACPCAFPGNPRCLGGSCALCGFGPNQPAGCPDGG
jgi:hypothetical protein